jgi:hypothetical protein
MSEEQNCNESIIYGCGENCPCTSNIYSNTVFLKLLWKVYIDNEFQRYVRKD